MRLLVLATSVVLALGVACGVRAADEESVAVKKAKPQPTAPDKDKMRNYGATTPVSGAVTLMRENTPFPLRGFARGTVLCIGDDSGPPGTYRLAFKYATNGQVLPFLECRMFEALEDRLAEHGRAARHGGVPVEVKGYVTEYRGTNFLLLYDFRVKRGPYPGGGEPATEEKLRKGSRSGR